LTPEETVTVGCVLQTTAIQVEFDQEFFSPFSRDPIWMTVGLRDLNNDAVVDHALKGPTSFQSRQPIAGRSHNGLQVLKFVFFAHSMRLSKKGTYRLLYSVHFPAARGFMAPIIWLSSGFVARNHPRFSKRLQC
jgi:hypothetical protein